MKIQKTTLAKKAEIVPRIFPRFIEWKDGLKSEIRGDVLMFDVPRYYKWIKEKDLFTYYIDFIYKSQP